MSRSLYQPERIGPELDALVQRALQADDNAPVLDGHKPWQPVPFHPAAAEAAALMREEMHRKPSRAQVADWMTALVAAVNRPPNQREFELRVDAVFAACDFPASLWSQESCIEAMRVFRFWPSVAEVHELLQRQLDRRWRIVVVLDRMTDGFLPGEDSWTHDARIAQKRARTAKAKP